MAPDEEVETTDDKDSAAQRAEEFRDRQEKAKEEIKEFESQDELPSDPKQYPDGPAKYLTIDADGEDPYGEGITGKLGPASVEDTVLHGDDDEERDSSGDGDEEKDA